jgi:hypothetical protein
MFDELMYAAIQDLRNYYIDPSKRSDTFLKDYNENMIRHFRRIFFKLLQEAIDFNPEAYRSVKTGDDKQPAAISLQRDLYRFFSGTTKFGKEFVKRMTI